MYNGAMEYISGLLILAFLVVGITKLYFRPRMDIPNGQQASRKYSYLKKPYIMTEREAKLYKRLEAITGNKYYIFPQIHLDAILDHRAKGQNWRAALSSIQRKSVDYVFVDKSTMLSTYALELDDMTHNYPDRIERDSLVAAELKNAGVPLIRLRDVEHLDDEQLKDELLTQAIALQ